MIGNDFENSKVQNLWEHRLRFVFLLLFFVVFFIHSFNEFLFLNWPQKGCVTQTTLSVKQHQEKKPKCIGAFLFLSITYKFIHTFHFYIDGQSRMAVLHVQNHRIAWHRVLRIAQETKSNFILAPLPSHIDASLRFYRRQIFCW